MSHQELLQLAKFVVIEVVRPEPFEGGRLDKLEHLSILRLWRISVKQHRASMHVARLPVHVAG